METKRGAGWPPHPPVRSPDDPRRKFITNQCGFKLPKCVGSDAVLRIRSEYTQTSHGKLGPGFAPGRSVTRTTPSTHHTTTKIMNFDHFGRGIFHDPSPSITMIILRIRTGRAPGFLQRPKLGGGSGHVVGAQGQTKNAGPAYFYLGDGNWW